MGWSGHRQARRTYAARSMASPWEREAVSKEGRAEAWKAAAGERRGAWLRDSAAIDDHQFSIAADEVSSRRGFIGKWQVSRSRPPAR